MKKKKYSGNKQFDQFDQFDQFGQFGQAVGNLFQQVLVETQVIDTEEQVWCLHSRVHFLLGCRLVWKEL